MATLGEQLRAAREGAGLTLEEAAALTRIPRQHLSALEADELAALPAVPFARGFIRIYADILGVPAEPLLEAYAWQLGAASYAIEPPASLIERRAGILPLAVVLVAAALIAVVVLAIVNRPEDEGGDTVPGPATQPAETDGELPPGSVLELVTAGELQLEVQVDGQTAFQGRIGSGSRQRWTPQQNITIHASDAGLVELTIDGQPAGRLGPAGTPLERSWRIVQPPSDERPAGP